MSKNSKVAIIGAGAMGSSILRGWIASTEQPADGLSGESFIVVDPGRDKVSALEKELGILGFTSVEDAVSAQQTPDIVMLAVKPQMMDGVLEELSRTDWFSNGFDFPLVISIAAGIGSGRIEEGLADGVHVVRVMPNLPLQVGLGASVVARGSAATAEELDLVCGLFASLGFASSVDESQIDAVCALSGGGPAYVAKMIEDLTSAGVRSGLSEQLAQQLVIATIGGSYRILSEAGMEPGRLREAVCSPGGTTLAALAAMDEAGFTRSINAGVDAAIDRAKELSR